MLTAVLRGAQGKSDATLNVGWESRNVFQRRANPIERFFARYGGRVMIIPLLGYCVEQNP